MIKNPSIVVFSMCTADKKLIYAEISTPEVHGDATIFRLSTLWRHIVHKEWVGDDIQIVNIGNTVVSPYLTRDFDFTIGLT